ncbi:hypothetical protein LINPERPRIM_LOCUS39525 [Linum perenne]
MVLSFSIRAKRWMEGSCETGWVDMWWFSQRILVFVPSCERNFELWLST